MTACGTPGGIHTARSGGTTKLPRPVSTVTEPETMWNSWAQRWLCDWKCSPASTSPAKVRTGAG